MQQAAATGYKFLILTNTFKQNKRQTSRWSTAAPLTAQPTSIAHTTSRRAVCPAVERLRATTTTTTVAFHFQVNKIPHLRIQGTRTILMTHPLTWKTSLTHTHTLVTSNYYRNVNIPPAPACGCQHQRNGGKFCDVCACDDSARGARRSITPAWHTNLCFRFVCARQHIKQQKETTPNRRLQRKSVVLEGLNSRVTYVNKAPVFGSLLDVIFDFQWEFVEIFGHADTGFLRDGKMADGGQKMCHLRWNFND